MTNSITRVGLLVSHTPNSINNLLINFFDYIPSTPSPTCINSALNRKVSILEIAKILKTPAIIAIGTISISAIVLFISIIVNSLFMLISVYSKKCDENKKLELFSCISENNPEKAHELLNIRGYADGINLYRIGKWAVENDYREILLDLIHLNVDYYYYSIIIDLLILSATKEDTRTLEFFLEQNIELPHVHLNQDFYVNNRIINVNTSIITRLPFNKECNTTLQQSHLESFKLLFAHQPDYKDRFGNSFLHLAVQSRNPLAVIWALEQEEPNINDQNHDGNTPLAIAARGTDANSLQIVSTLLTKKDLEIDLANQFGETPLSQVCKNLYNMKNLPNSYDVLKLLLENGANPNYQLQHGITPFILIMKSGYNEFVQLFLDHNIDVNAIVNNASLITIAINIGHAETVKSLSQAREFNPDVRNDGGTLLHEIAQLNKPEIFKTFAKREKLYEKNNLGETPLHTAVKVGSLQIVWYYCREAETLLDETNGNGETPLYLALISESHSGLEAHNKKNIANLLAKQSGVDIQKTYDLVIQGTHQDKEQHLNFLKNYLPGAKSAYYA